MLRITARGLAAATLLASLAASSSLAAPTVPAATPADAASPVLAVRTAAPLRSRSDAAAALRARGYRYVRRVEPQGGGYVAEGFDRIGNRVQLRIDARTRRVAVSILGGSVTPVTPPARLPAVARPFGNDLHLPPPGGSYYHPPVVNTFHDAAGLPLRPSAIPPIQRCGVIGALCR